MTTRVAVPAPRRLGVWLVLLALIAASGVAALSLGTPTIAPTRLIGVLSGPDEVPALVLRELRIPRLVLGLIAGAALGVAGLVLQEALRNPLAAPDLVGVPGVMVDDVLAAAPWLVLSVPAAVLAAPVLAVLRLGDEAAGALGVRVERARAAALAIAVVLVGPIVAVCGPVAWVGLLAPHLARRLRPADDALGWLPLSALCGALVVIADLVARLALAPIETPLGAWTAMAGVVGGLALARRQGFVR